MVQAIRGESPSPSNAVARRDEAIEIGDEVFRCAVATRSDQSPDFVEIILEEDELSQSTAHFTHEFDCAGRRLVTAPISIGHAEIVSSDRDQDLGMMAKRMFITTRVADPATMPAARSEAATAVTVLLGAPRRPDTIKRDGRFNPEDVEAVRRLKDALGQIPGYCFDYLDDHSVWLDELRNPPPRLAMNLCDDGFDNDAVKEAQVPARLRV